MWHDADPEQGEQDDRYPFYPVDTGSPIVAAILAICAVGAVAAIFVVRPWP